MQTNTTYDKVANLSLDMLCDTSKAASARVAAASSTAASAQGDGTETPSQPQPRRLHAMARRRAHPWKIQNIVERGFEIPICITDTSAVPELGNFIRFGMDAAAIERETSRTMLTPMSVRLKLTIDYPPAHAASKYA